MKLLLACDKTFGHVAPALAVADFLKPADTYIFLPQVRFRKLAQDRGLSVVGRALRFKGKLAIIGYFWRFFESFYLLTRIRPVKIIGFGGRETFFLIIAAKLLRIPVYLYEPNFIVGKANKFLSRISDRLFLGFEQTKLPPYAKGEWVGILVRNNLKVYDKIVAKQKLGFSKNDLVFLCFGGSQGSLFINDIFSRWINEFNSTLAIIHVTGSKQYQDFLRFYDKMENKKVSLFSFCSDIDLLYSAADIALARAGASTVAEVCFYQLPTVFIPYPGANNHQYANAYYLYQRGGCSLITQQDFSYSYFDKIMRKLAADSQLRAKIKNNLAKIKLAKSGSSLLEKII